MWKKFYVKLFYVQGTGVLNAVQARLARRQLAKLTPDGLVEYALQVSLFFGGVLVQILWGFD